MVSWLEVDQHLDVARFIHDQSDTSTYLFNKDSNGHYIQGDRIVADTTISFLAKFAGLDIKTSLLHFYRQYDLVEPLDGQKSTKAILNITGANLDVALHLIKQELSNSRHHLQMRAHYLYVPYRNQEAFPNFDTEKKALSVISLFANNRFDGGDRIGDNERLSLGGIYTLELFGQSVLSLGVARAWYNEKRQVHLQPILSSVETGNYPPSDKRYYENQARENEQYALDRLSTDTIFHLSYQPNKHWSINTDIVGLNQVNRAHNSLSYVDDDYQLQLLFNYHRRVTSVAGTAESFRTYDPSVKDIAIISSWSYSDSLAIHLAVKRHLVTNLNLDTSLSLEYQDCCWGFEMGYYKRVLKDTTPIALQSNVAYRQGVFLTLKIYGTDGN